MALNSDRVNAALAGVTDPELRTPLTELDMVGDISITDEELSVEILLTIVGCPAAERIEQDTRSALEAVLEGRRLNLTLGVMTPDQRATLVARLREGKPSTNPFTPDSLTRVIAVTSGKGGVGKSSLTVNLAAGVSQAGFRVASSTPTCLGFPFPVCSALMRFNRPG